MHAGQAHPGGPHAQQREEFWRSRPAGYLLAAVAVALTLLVRALLDPYVGEQHAFATFFPAVAAAAWFFGFGPGVFATVLSALSNLYFFIGPTRSLAGAVSEDMVGLGLFLLSGIIVSGIAGVAKRRRRAVMEAQVELGRLAAIVQTSAEAILAKDLNGIVTHWNPGAEKLFGYSAAEMVGQPIIKLFPPELVNEEEAILAKIRRGEPVLYYQTRRRRKDGSMVDVSATISPIRDQSGTIVGASSIKHDITDLKLAEASLRRAKEELEQRVAERTRELSVALDKAREVDRLKSEFLATMSHELRTPLNSIIGFTEIIIAGMAGPVTEEQKRQLTMALNSARHLLHLINDLLDLARIESGRAELHPEPVRVRDVLAEVTDTLRPLANRKQLAIETDLEGEPEVMTDRKMLFQILLNLGNNAVKFTERGRVTITAKTQEDSFTVAVRDTGIGIRPENLALLFEAFRQVERSARRRYEGTGLGLHLSRRLARLLGGDITAQSQLGVGSTFTVTIPRQLPARP